MRRSPAMASQARGGEGGSRRRAAALLLGVLASSFAASAGRRQAAKRTAGCVSAAGVDRCPRPVRSLARTTQIRVQFAALNEMQPRVKEGDSQKKKRLLELESPSLRAPHRTSSDYTSLSLFLSIPQKGELGRKICSKRQPPPPFSLSPQFPLGEDGEEGAAQPSDTNLHQ